MPKVFISSTSEDLAGYRQVAINTCLSLDLQPVDMEHFPAMGKGAVEGSKHKLADCDVYVGIFAYRYGYIEDGYEQSVTEIEFHYAEELGIERLCFLVDPEYPWPETGRDYENYELLQGFKEKLEKTVIRNYFTTNDDFRAKLTQALVHWSQSQSLFKPGQPDPFRNYLLQLQQEITDYLERFILDPIVIPTKPITQGTDKLSEIPAPSLLPTFFTTSIPVKKQRSTKANKPRFFEHFTEAFNFFDGRMVILGEPGAGKTTILMMHALECVKVRLDDFTKPLPVVVRIADWPLEKNLSLTEWLSVQSNLENRFLSTLQKRGLLLLFLDGLDELALKSRKNNALERFLKALESGQGDNQVVITCRTKDYENISGKPSVNGMVSVLPLNDKRIKDYLENSPHVWSLLKTDTDLRKAVRTPLLLNTLIFAIGEDENGRQLSRIRNLSELPGRIQNAIIQKYVERRYEHERKKGSHDLSSLDRVYNILGYIAAEILAVSDRFEPEIITDRFGGKSTLNAVLKLNLLIEDHNKNLRFAHQVFERHFAVTYRKNELLNDTTLFERLSAAKVSLDEDFISAFADVDLIEALVVQLQDSEDKARIDNLYQFISFLELIREQAAGADEGMSDVADIQLEVNKLAVSVFTACLDNNDPETRYYAILGLWKTGGEKGSIEPLMSSLNDENEDVRAVAAEVLGDLMVRQAVIPITAILNDPSDTVQEAAKWALSKLQK